MLRSFHAVIMMISLLVIIKNFLVGGTAPLADPSPGGDSRTENKYVRIPEICIKMCHFKIKSSKYFPGREGTQPLPGLHPLGAFGIALTWPCSFATLSHVAAAVPASAQVWAFPAFLGPKTLHCGCATLASLPSQLLDTCRWNSNDFT